MKPYPRRPNHWNHYSVFGNHIMFVSSHFNALHLIKKLSTDLCINFQRNFPKKDAASRWAIKGEPSSERSESHSKRYTPSSMLVLRLDYSNIKIHSKNIDNIKNWWKTASATGLYIVSTGAHLPCHIFLLTCRCVFFSLSYLTSRRIKIKCAIRWSVENC